MKPEAIAADWLTNLIPDTFVVPAMVTVVNLLQQKYRYSYITVS
jgi:hypothetical protein